MISKAQSGHAENRVAKSQASDMSTEPKGRTIEQEILQVLHESLVRYGGAGQVSVRTVSRAVSKRVKGVKNKQSLMFLVRDVLESLSWASFWGNGYRRSRKQGHLGGRLYALEMGPAELAQVKEQLMERSPVRTQKV